MRLTVLAASDHCAILVWQGVADHRKEGPALSGFPAQQPAIAIPPSFPAFFFLTQPQRVR
jgi:hypothetical protein